VELGHGLGRDLGVQGMGYAEVERRGIYLPVREAACRYRAPAYYDQLVQVRAGISAWSRASMTFAYEAWDEERATLLATGSTQHACVNGNGRPVRVPDWLREMFV
jgi:acyl-CoA thioester hydrolase